MSKPGWKDIPIGGVITEAGNAAQYRTGDWRTFKPVLDEDECISCLQCWIHCPDAAIMVEEGKMVGYDYEHCKGCGICASVCPKNCIEMVRE